MRQLLLRLAGMDYGRAVRVAMLLGVLLSLPLAAGGFAMDDYLHLALLQGLEGAPGSAFDLYRFTPGDSEGMRELMITGPYPWWSDPDVHIAFLRPLASAMGGLDYALFGAWMPGYHLHSTLWYGALIASIALVMRRVVPGPLAVIALLLYAIDDVHAQPVGWVANRNALVALTPAFLGFAAHMRWRVERWRPGLALSLVGLGLGFAGGETALGVCAYLGAWELCSGPGSLRERMRSLVPAATLSSVWLLLHGALGYGAQASGIYLDPRRDPWVWLMEAPARATGLIGAQVLAAPVDAWMLAPPLVPGLIGAGLFSILALGLMLRATWSTFSEGERRGILAMALGGALSLAPVLSTFPLGRLLLGPGVGLTVVVAAVLVGIARLVRPSHLLQGGAALLVFCNVAIVPLGWLGQLVFLSTLHERQEAIAAHAEVDPTTLADERVVLLSAPDPTTAFYPMLVRFRDGVPLPGSYQLLSLAPYAHRVTRSGERSLELQVVDGQMMEGIFEKLFRRPEQRFAVGDQVDLDWIVVEVLELGSVGPTRVRASFETPLEDPGLRLLVWRDGALRRLVPPKTGEVVELPFSLGAFSTEPIEGL